MVHCIPVQEQARPDGRARRDAIDFWRGALFCTIFINHVPGNLFETLTPKNYGFSDSAEAFVFLSGLSLGFAQRKRDARGEGASALRLVGRAGKLYGLHIGLSLAGLLIYVAAAALSDSMNLLDQHGRALLLQQPAQGLLGLLSLGHQIGYFNILPVYVAMLAMAPALLWIDRRSPVCMLLASAGLYAAARTLGWNLPTWPIPGAWFFDPFTWQLLLGFGIAAARLRRPPLSSGCDTTLLIASLAIVALAAWSVTNGFSSEPGLQDWTRGWADLDKTTLGLGRLVHFLCAAYVLYALDAAERLRHFAIFPRLCRIGRRGLPMFMLLSLLAAVGQVTTAKIGHHVLSDAMVIGVGLWLMGRATRIMDRLARPIALPGHPTETGIGPRALQAIGASRWAALAWPLRGAPFSAGAPR